MSFIMWGSLFFTVLNQAHQTHQLLKYDNTLLAQQKQTLASIQANARTRTAQLNELQNHIDCLFNLATQPNHSTAYIVNSQDCTLATASSTPSTPGSSVPVSAPVSSPGSSAYPQSAPNTTNKQATQPPQPAPSVIQQILNVPSAILKRLGL